MKKYYCVPMALTLPVIFLFGSAICILEYFTIFSREDPIMLYFAAFSFAFVLFLLPTSLKRIEIHSDKVICKGLFPHETFKIETLTCNVGMDYHIQNGSRIWWIYISEGPVPEYKSKNPTNRINSIKIRPGFIRIMYSNEVYDALIDVLPKKQKTALITAVRCADFGKQ